MTFVDGPGRLFEADDVSLATEVASRAGVALSNATRFQREHVVADVLQRAVLPDSLPDVEGLLLDAEYRAGVAGTYAGGDWYDVFELGEDSRLLQRRRRHGQGRAGRRPHGTGAQCHPGLRRLRPVADRGALVARPSLRRAHRGSGGHRRGRDHHPLHRARWSSATPATRRRSSSAPTAAPPSARCSARSSSRPDSTGAPRPRDEVVLDRGDSLIMYSDGLIERRGEVITHGMERLAETATVVARAGWPDHPATTFAVHAERRRAHRRRRRALHQLHRCPSRVRYPPSQWVRHEMACQHCISNRWWRAHPLRATGWPRIYATSPPM